MTPSTRHGVRRLVPITAALAGLIVPIAALSAATAAPSRTSSATSARPTAGRVAWHAKTASAAPAKTAPRSAHQTAVHALDRAESVLHPSAGLLARRPMASDPSAMGSRDASMALRDLAVHRSQLTGQDRVAAAQLLARPAASKVACNAQICVHWETSGDNAPNLTDANGNGIPDYVDTVMKTVSHVQKTYVAAGYRKPESDHGRGGNDKPDIYLSNLGPQGLYGYCTTDKSSVPTHGPHDVWAYCVLDNDYAEFPDHTPLENLEVTAAHEYFHAVQFAYDILEDQWFMEATATWAEDELYTKVNDNLQYLPASPIAKPRHPMDKGGGFGVYGDWIFFRYLTEHLTTKQGGLPTLVRDFWRKADSSKVRYRHGKVVGHDYYSLQAISKVLKTRGLPLPTAFAKFAAANMHTHTAYHEGAANDYPESPVWGSVTLDPQHRKKTVGKPVLDHLTSATARFFPGKGMASSTWTLTLKVDMAPTARGSAAVLTVYPVKGGKPKTIVVKLDKSGNAKKSVAFSSKKVAAVDLTVADAGSQFVCHRNKAFSCQGISKDDNAVEKLMGLISKK